MANKIFIKYKVGEKYRYINLASLTSAEFAPESEEETASISLHHQDGTEISLSGKWAMLVKQCLDDMATDEADVLLRTSVSKAMTLKKNQNK